MMNELISIIVPIYNTMEYLEQCVESICSQTYENIEIILVDDGSTDGSSGICDQFQEKDKRIKVIHKENEGAVKARIDGVYHAGGNIVSFVDSDDWIESDMYESMLNEMVKNKLDLVVCAYYTEKDDVKIPILNAIEPGVYEGKQMIELHRKMMFYEQEGTSGVLPSQCMKLFKKDILKECMELVNKRLTLGDDAATVYTYLLRAKKVAILNDTYYRYTIRKTSMSHANDTKKFEDIYQFHKLMKEIFCSYSDALNLQEQLNQYTYFLLRVAMKNSFGIKFVPHYQLPNDIWGKRIVIYGAGVCGKVYVRQIVDRKDCNLVGWVDKQLAGNMIMDVQILSPEEMKELEFDICVIAVTKEELAREIRMEIEEYVDSAKVIWEKPIRTGGYDAEFA